MKTTVLLLAVAVAAAPASAQQKLRRHSPRPPIVALAPGDRAPELFGASLAGSLARADWSARPYTLVNFWATWCEPCRTEMPVLGKLWEEHGDRVQVLGVLTDTVTNAEARSFAGQVGAGYEIFRGTPALQNAWGGISLLPTTFLIDRDGKILRRYVGATGEIVAGMRADLDALLDGKPLPVQVEPELEDSVTTAPPSPVSKSPD